MGCVSATGVHLASALLLANHACFVWTQRGNWATATAAAEPSPARAAVPRPRRKRARPKPGLNLGALQWAQCEACDVWRVLPKHVQAASLPDHFVCAMSAQWSREGGNSEVFHCELTANNDGSTSPPSSAEGKLAQLTPRPDAGLLKRARKETLFSPATLKRLHYRTKSRPASAAAVVATITTAAPAAPAAAPAAPAPAAPGEQPIEWVQCDECGKWHILPSYVAAAELPERFVCAMSVQWAAPLVGSNVLVKFWQGREEFRGTVVADSKHPLGSRVEVIDAKVSSDNAAAEIFFNLSLSLSASASVSLPSLYFCCVCARVCVFARSA